MLEKCIKSCDFDTVKIRDFYMFEKTLFFSTGKIFYFHMVSKLEILTP